MHMYASLCSCDYAIASCVCVCLCVCVQCKLAVYVMFDVMSCVLCILVYVLVHVCMRYALFSGDQSSNRREPVF